MNMPKERKCVECDKTGSIHVSIVLGGKLTTESYCRAHAEQCGVSHSVGYDLLGLRNIEEEVAVQLELNVLRCESCGCSQHDFEKSGRLGCPQCYLTFGTLLNPLLSKMHAGGSHLGKIPEKAIAENLLNTRIKHLETQLQDAVTNEHYEDAAQYRDKINEFKQLASQSVKTN
jgi:protein arginine kinase activator